LEDLLPESGFYWKKDRQDTMFRKIRKFQKNTTRLYFARRLKKPEGGSERSHRVGSPPGGAGPPLATPDYGEATLACFCHHPFAYIVVPENLSEGGLRDRHRRLCGAENTRERKALRQAGICQGIPSRRGQIVAIVIAIAPDFIGIIIIISITSTFISTITTPSRCNILS
jgi:hypothetical protein